ncbi:transposase domain-containing protein [Streptomyces sp. SRF1]|uniref:transposase domain-containing protein n=1 Tax=Streptomyces sp. SRF1 TaxID=1549642 RepID=UPI00339D6F91
MLTQAFPQSLVDEVLAKTGRGQQRNRLLPARLVVSFVLTMCLFSEQIYEEVARLLTAGLQGALRWRGSWVVPSTATIAFRRDWRLAAIDGTTFDLPDTRANVEAFGRPPRSRRGEQDVGYPQFAHGRPGGVRHPRRLRRCDRSSAHRRADSGPGRSWCPCGRAWCCWPTVASTA